jgi:hypothetical protein
MTDQKTKTKRREKAEIELLANLADGLLDHAERVEKTLDELDELLPPDDRRDALRDAAAQAQMLVLGFGAMLRTGKLSRKEVVPESPAADLLSENREQVRQAAVLLLADETAPVPIEELAERLVHEPEPTGDVAAFCSILRELTRDPSSGIGEKDGGLILIVSGGEKD